MSDGPITLTEVAPSPSASAPSAEEVRRRWFELLLVFLLAFGGAIFRSIWILRTAGNLPPHTGTGYLASVLEEFALLLLLAYVLSRRGMRIRDLGLRFSLRDIGAGLGVFFVSAVVYFYGRWFLAAIQHAYFLATLGGHSAREVFGRPSWQVIPLILINPFFEELTVRAYLMSEIKALTGSWTLAVVFSVAVQTAYHLYYGWAGALGLSFQFLVFAAFYAWRRKALPIIVAHGLFDAWAFARLL